MNGLMRRVLVNGDGKMTFNEFARIIKPVDLGPYLKRIMKRTKAEDKCAEEHRNAVLMNEQAEKVAYQRKPLTAFKKSQVMLNKDPERHVRLMPLEFELTGQLSAVPS